MLKTHFRVLLDDASSKFDVLAVIFIIQIMMSLNICTLYILNGSICTEMMWWLGKTWGEGWISGHYVTDLFHDAQ